jgi:hypothetical protein
MSWINGRFVFDIQTTYKRKKPSTRNNTKKKKIKCICGRTLNCHGCMCTEKIKCHHCRHMYLKEHADKVSDRIEYLLINKEENPVSHIIYNITICGLLRISVGKKSIRKNHAYGFITVNIFRTILLEEIDKVPLHWLQCAKHSYNNYINSK